jgi:adenylyltransferase/sulfurtransferase
MVPSCAEGGVFGVLPGIVGCLQATEVIKILTGIGQPLVGKLLLFDALSMSFRVVKVRPNPDKPPIERLIDYEQFCGIPQAREAEQKGAVREISVVELKAMRDRGEPHFLFDVRRPFEAEIASMGADQLIPVEELEQRYHEVLAGKEDTVVVHCKMGGRSARAARMLRDKGFTKVVNLAGGISAWSEKIDPSVPKY